MTTRYQRAGIVVLLAVVLALASVPAAAGTDGFIQPGPRDKCPVCGMFVARYPDWVAEVLFRDGSYAVFDGVKDLMKFYLDPEGHGVRMKVRRSDITAVIVMDYYSVKPIDGRQAWYVLGSDVYGPMGRELVPFAKEGDAREFLKDHRGTDIVRFSEITPEMVAELDR